MPTTCRWGVLGTGQIIGKMGPALPRTPNSEWFGVAGRTLANSQRIAEQYGVSRAYAGYQELLDDPEIDAVYIALLNHLHAEWALRAIEAGKHVLLEKPFTLNAAEAKRIEEAARERGVLVMEGFLWRVYEGHHAAKKMIEDGVIGEVQKIDAHFNFSINPDVFGSRLVKEWGGGSVYDIGCYVVSYIRYFVGEEPEQAFAHLEIDPVHDVDMRCLGTLHFAKGKSAHLFTAMDLPFDVHYHIYGTKGRISSGKVHASVPLQLTVQVGDESTVHTFDTIDQHGKQFETFAHSVLTGAPLPYDARDAVANMAVLDALFASHQEGRKVSVQRP